MDTATRDDAKTNDDTDRPTDDSLQVDPSTACERAESFLRESVASADAAGVVVNLSGGLDSTVTAALAVEALGPERVYGLVQPST